MKKMESILNRLALLSLVLATSASSILAEDVIGLMETLREVKAAGPGLVREVSFTTEKNLPGDARFLVTYPAGFDVSKAAVFRASGFDGGFSKIIKGQVLVLSRSSGHTAPPGEKIIALSGIVNKSTNATYKITLEIQNGVGEVLLGPTTSARLRPTVHAADE
ncbi:MAG: hypothetical protein HY674_00830 [Chloroflexi bacterium]|nr:hypothetical protein [Chloroflexota bacterium]